MLRFVLTLCIVLMLLAACAGGTVDAPSTTDTTNDNSPLSATATEESEQVAAVPEPEEVQLEPTATLTVTSEATDDVEATEDTEAIEETPTVIPSTATPPPSTATALPPTAVPFDPEAVDVRLEPVASGFEMPLLVTAAGDGSGRLFVVEKAGAVRVVQDGEVNPTPFLDIRDRVGSQGYEQGLLGLAFEPGRPERFYVNYTGRDGNTVISRFRTTGDPNVADPTSEEVLLRIAQPAPNHNGGHLLFGPDGYLWIGMGDGGGAGDRYQNAQNPSTLLGSMLRLDVSGETGYTIPPDNPYVASGGGAPEIWAIGLRNPWRWSFDRETGALWLGDVGQGRWEEIDRVPSDSPGLNFGWPILEGSHCFLTEGCDRDGYVLPVTEYSHDFGCSITGGYVYRGQAFPELRDGYFFADFCSGLLWTIPANVTEAVEPILLAETGLPISSFGEDEAGELYLTAFDGTLYRLVSAGGGD